MEINQSLKAEIVNNPDGFIYGFCKSNFKTNDLKPMELTDYQVEIVGDIFFRRHLRELVWASTRAGKSLAVALGIIMLASFWKGRMINIIAPTEKHTQIIMNYIIQHLFDSENIRSRLLMGTSSDSFQLKKQISKNRITFKENSEVKIVTANISGEGRSLIGFGGTDNFIDEGELIPSQIIRSNIMRMLGDSPDSRIFITSNPHHKGFMFDHKDDPVWKKIKIGWKQCVEQGRLTQEFVDQQRKDLTPVEFKIWYDSDYPEDSEDTLIKWSWIERAVRRKPDPKVAPVRLCGADIAAGGVDSTVVMAVYRYEGLYIVEDIEERNFGPEENRPTKKAEDLIKNMHYKHNFDGLVIDSQGIGQRVYETFLDIDDIKNKLNGFVAGGRIEDEEDRKRFVNLKAKSWTKLAKLFEQGKIIIPDDTKLKAQLNQIKFKRMDGSGKMMILKKEKGQKSPDHADALMMAVSYDEGPQAIFDFV